MPWPSWFVCPYMIVLYCCTHSYKKKKKLSEFPHLEDYLLAVIQCQRFCDDVVLYKHQPERATCEQRMLLSAMWPGSSAVFQPPTGLVCVIWKDHRSRCDEAGSQLIKSIPLQTKSGSRKTAAFSKTGCDPLTDHHLGFNHHPKCQVSCKQPPASTIQVPSLFLVVCSSGAPFCLWPIGVWTYTSSGSAARPFYSGRLSAGRVKCWGIAWGSGQPWASFSDCGLEWSHLSHR